MRIYIVRFLTAFIFFFLGFSLVGTIVPNVQLFGYKEVPQIVVGLLLGGLGFIAFPSITTVLSRLVAEFSDHVARQVVDLVARRIDQMRISREKKKNKNGEKKPEFLMPMFLDTSAVIDGRIVNIVKTGFLAGTILVPKFILAELHHIADSSDSLRRQRGRRGLEILEELKKFHSSSFKCMVFSNETIKAKEVDTRLIELAKKYKARIITVDFNLNKVAKVSGVDVLNVNELANSVKTTVLPGEDLTINVVQVGKDPSQGVGYLEDGTMVVVEQGSVLVGQTVTITVSRLLQTAAGKMIFAKRFDTNPQSVGKKILSTFS